MDDLRVNLDVPIEVVRVNITAIGEKGDPGDGSGGSGVDAYAREQAAQAKTAAAQVQADLLSHKTASQPHKAYDQDLPDLTLIFKNGLI